MQGRARGQRAPARSASTGGRPVGGPGSGGGPVGGEAPRIELEGLTKRFGAKTAVDGVDIAVDPGTFLVLLGPSGSGKSTLLRCLAGIERSTAGTIRFDDEVVDGPGGHLPPERRDLAMVFQDYALWPHLNAEQNVGFALKRRRCSSEERKRLSLAMLEQVGLRGFHDRYPGQLSGGEQQRVALARALVGRPGLLLFDEPLSNLDADRRERLRVDIGAMVRQQGATAVYITHDQAEAFALADVIGVLNAGRLVQLGAPEEVFRAPLDAFVARFTGLAGELSGRVVADPDSDANRVAITFAGTVIVGRPVGPSPQPGRTARLLVRPSAVRFAGPGNERQRGIERDGRGPTSEIDAIVRDAAFRGWGYEHVVELAGGVHLAGVPANRRLPFAARVRVELRADGCLAVEEPEPGSTAGNEPVPKEELSVAAGPGARSPAGLPA